MESSRPDHWVNNAGTEFRNPWRSSAAPSVSELIQSRKLPLATYDKEFIARAKANDRKVVKPDWGESSLKHQSLRKQNVLIGTWLGHGGALVEVSPLQSQLDVSPPGRSSWLLFDPILSKVAGPTQYTGVTRLEDAPCKIEDLPGCDAVFITHNHYDHLDLNTIKAIMKKFPEAKYFVPLRNKQWFIDTGVSSKNINELDWWQDRICNLPDLSIWSSKQNSDPHRLRITCVPAQHNSGRSVTDQRSTLWCGWVVERFEVSSTSPEMTRECRKGAIYHAGDTGYRGDATSDIVCPAFKEIGDKFGPLDLSFIPIWRGGTLGFVSYLGMRLSLQDLPSTAHGTPQDAADIHRDVRSRNTVAIHWGTFVGSDAEAYEAMLDFKKACDHGGIQDLNDVSTAKDEGRAGTLDFGGSIAVQIE